MYLSNSTADAYKARQLFSRLVPGYCIRHTIPTIFFRRYFNHWYECKHYIRSKWWPQWQWNGNTAETISEIHLCRYYSSICDEQWYSRFDFWRIPVTGDEYNYMIRWNDLYDNINPLIIDNGISTVNGVSNSSFVNGPVKKTGNQAFTFPLLEEIRFTGLSVCHRRLLNRSVRKNINIDRFQLEMWTVLIRDWIMSAVVNTGH